MSTEVPADVCIVDWISSTCQYISRIHAEAIFTLCAKTLRHRKQNFNSWLGKLYPRL